MSLFAELRRRNVIRVAIFYIVSSWLALQVADIVLPAVGAPEWVLKVLLAMLAIGFLPSLIFAWAYELTPEGIKKEQDVDRSQSIVGHTGKRLDIAVIVLLVAVAGLTLVDRVLPPQAGDDEIEAQGNQGSPPASLAQADRRPPDKEAGPGVAGEPSIAVLPFINRSDDPANEYFSDGISEELLNVLVGIDGLRVPSRTTSFRYKGSDLPLNTIAAELGVEHVLEGSVRKAGDQVRITAQLIEADTDTHVWSGTFTRTLDDIFAIQSEIATAIVDQLKVTLGADDTLAGAGTDDSEAYNHYLKGRYYWLQRTEEGFEAAERELRSAVDRDPTYGDAWAALADVYVLMPEYDWAPVDEAIPKARAALDRALAINRESARALTVRAYVRYLYDFDYRAAEADFQDAIGIDPDYATAHQWFAEMLGVLRRFDEAEFHARRALELDPLSPIRSHVLGNVLVWDGRLDEAVDYYHRALELAPGWVTGQRNLIVTQMERENYDEAMRLLGEFTGEAEEREVKRLVISVLAGEAPVETAIEAVLNSSYPCTPAATPRTLIALGAPEVALDKLEQCFQQVHPYMPFINTRWYDELRDRPRFQALLARVNLLESDS